MNTLSPAINIGRIRAFINVAETRSVSMAAEQLNRTAPAVSKSIHELEAALGATLLIRSSRGMSLTSAGQTFLVRAKLALAELENGADEIATQTGQVQSKLVVGALPNGSQPIVSLAAARFLKQWPKVGLSIRGGSHDSLFAAVRSGDMELLVGVLPDDEGREGLVTEVLFKDELAVIVRPDHPLDGRRKLKSNELGDQKWLVPDLSGGLREKIECAFDKLKIERPSGFIEVTPLGAMRTILRETDYLAVTTRMRVRDDLEFGILKELPVKLPGSAESIAIVHRPAASMSKFARIMRDHIKDVARAMTPR